MQMPGGNQGNSLTGYATIGLRTSSERRSRRATRASSTDRQSRPSLVQNDTLLESGNAVALTALVPRPSSADGRDVNEVASNGVSGVEVSKKRSRSKLKEFLDNLSRPFMNDSSSKPRPRSRSAVPNTRLPLQPQPENPPVLSAPESISVTNGSMTNSNYKADKSKKPAQKFITQAWDNFLFANGRTPGVMGIGNHGNTCFMNAIVQCLSNTEYFAEYFVTDRCQSDILAAQRAGRSCTVTGRFAQLIASLWTCEYRSNISIAFKACVGEQASQYSGEEQNDAQEFLQWLLDHINEELYGSSIANVDGHIKKGITSSVRSNPTGINGYPTVNIVHDLFLAQFRSTITCPHCGENSCKLDPFLLVPLPISEKYKIPVNTTVVRSHPSPSLIRIAAMLSTADSMIDVRHSIAARTTIPPAQLVLLQVSNDIGFVRNFHNYELLSDAEEGIVNLFAVQIATVASTVPTIAIIAVNIYVTEKDSRKFGYPFMLHAPRDLAANEFRLKLLNSMSELLTDSAASRLESISGMFRLRLTRDELDGCEIQDDVELPLYITEIDEALLDCDISEGPQHIKLTLEWDYGNYKKWILPGNRRATPFEDASVKQIKSESQHLSAATLDDCFRDFTQKERLGTNDKWYCPKCKRHRSEAIKSMSLFSLPDIMVVQLKRFKQESDENRVKLNALIQFPLEGLDMRRHVETAAGDETFTDNSDCIYDLYAVCNHIGNLQGGHYTAFCKNPINGQWYKFDDEKVTSLRSDSAVVTKAAYLLCYRRRAAHSRCKNGLRQFISAICVASGPVRTPVQAYRQPDYVHDQQNGDGFRRSSVNYRSGRSQFFLSPPQQQFSTGTMRSSRPANITAVPTASMSHAARKAILNRRAMASSSSSYNDSLSQSSRPGAGSYAFPKSMSDSRVSSRTRNSFLQHAVHDYEKRQNQTPRAEHIPQSRTQPSNAGSTTGATSASRSFVSGSTRSNGTPVFDKSVATTAVTSSESDSETDAGSESSSSVAPPVPPKTYPSTATGQVTISNRAPKLVFEKVISSTTQTKESAV